METTEAMHRFIEDRQLRRLAPKTIDAYMWALNKLVNAYPVALPRTPQHIQQIFSDNSYLAEESIRDLWSRLRTFWIWAEEGICENIMARVLAPPNRRKFPRTLTDEEVERLMSSVSTDRDYKVLAVLLDTGIRIGELASITPTSIKTNSLLVFGKIGDRSVPISPHVARMLLSQGNQQHTWVGRQGKLTNPMCKFCTKDSNS